MLIRKVLKENPGPNERAVILLDIAEQTGISDDAVQGLVDIAEQAK